MNDIEPYYLWRDLYDAASDERSPFFGNTYSEFSYSNRVYNYYIHPQWDEFGSETLYTKLLFADYDEAIAIFEFIGEWNDCIQNDISFFKRDVADVLIENGIRKFILLGEHVLNFHASDDCYYEEWKEDIMEENGWICMVNFLDHVIEEMRSIRIQDHVFLGKKFNEINWRKLNPYNLAELIESKIN